MTLEEAMKKIESLEADKKKILDEKKEMLKIFQDKDKEDMTETEKKIAEVLEQEAGKRTELEKKLEAEQKAREKSEAERAKIEADRAKAEQEKVSKALTERLTKVAKGDQEILKRLQANVELLKDLPKQTDAELDTAVNLAYNMMGAGSVNPLSATGGVSNNNPDIASKESFSSTEKGKAVAERMGLSFTKVEQKPEQK